LEDFVKYKYTSSYVKSHKTALSFINGIVNVWQNDELFCSLQLLVTQFSETTGFGATFSDSQSLAHLDLNDLLAFQFHSGDTQLSESSPDRSQPDQVPILAINTLPNSAADDMAV